MPDYGLSMFYIFLLDLPYFKLQRNTISGLRPETPRRSNTPLVAGFHTRAISVRRISYVFSLHYHYLFTAPTARSVNRVGHRACRVIKG